MVPADLGLSASTVRTVSADGVPSSGWYIRPARAVAPAVLLIHGYGGRRDRMLGIARFLHAAGFGVAIMDLRHHGEAGDAPVTFGPGESADAEPYLDHVRALPQHAGQRIGVLGCSLGAVAALHLASRRADISAIVADSPFDSLVRQTDWQVRQSLPGALAWYARFFVLLSGALTAGIDPAECDATRWLPAIAPRPILFIHGCVDRRIPADATRRLIAAAPGPVEAWFAPGADHLDAMDDPQGLYSARITDFLRRSL
jgi:fermentation-respiration switch protein FrsA (DUF1100 family)